MTITEFLLQRIADDEKRAHDAAQVDGADRMLAALPDPVFDGLRAGFPNRVLAECEAKRRIVELHQSWPVLVEEPPTIEDVGDLNSVTFRMSQKMAWLTEQEYRTKFGDEPPTAPMLSALAAVYADHEDYDEAWRP